MDEHQIFIAAASVLVVSVYALRLNNMTWRTHLFRCILAQLSGAVLSCMLIYAAAEGASPGWLYPALLALLTHLSLTVEKWPGGVPPRETETRPMPLDGLHQ